MRRTLFLAWFLVVGHSVAVAQPADLIPGPTSTPGFDAATHVPAAHFGTLPLLYSNGGLATGTTTGSGVAVPTSGYQWSEVQADAGNTTESNTNAGFSCSITTTATFRCADDFTVSAGQTWTVDAVSAFAYQTGYAGVPSPFVAATLQIWDGPPNDPGSTVLFGDTSTNRLQSSFEAGLYRIFNTTTPPPGTAPGTTRRIWENVIAVSPGLSLPPGTYWVDFNFLITGNLAHFSPAVTVAGSRGTPGANALQFNSTTGAWAAAIDTGNPATAPDVALDFPVQIYGTSLTPTYTLTSPNSGASVLAGTRTWVRWTGPGVPNSADVVEVYLRDGSGSLTLLGSGPNRGRYKATLPLVLPTASDYTFVVRRQADPSVFGVSAPFTIYTTGEQFTFSEPDGGETWRRGTTKTITWATPPSAPSGAVTVRWFRGSGLLLGTYNGEANDGSLDIAVPADLTTGDFYFTIVSEADPAFFGQSNVFSIQRFEGTAPAEGATWAVGSSQTVSWTSGANAGGQLRVALRSRTTGTTTVVSSYGPYTDFSRTITVPGVPAGEYEVQYLHRYTPPGGTEARIFAYSNAITVTNPLAPEAPARHFAPPLAAEGSPETMLVVTGLADGTEVGAFATTADGAEVLLASGVVADGEAVFAVPSDVVDGAGELSFGASSALTLRTYASGMEAALSSEVRLAEGAVVVVEASKGASSAGAAVSVATVVPNPTSGAATVRFTLPEASAATVTVYDMLGRAATESQTVTGQAGDNVVALPTALLPPGVYVVRVTTAGTTVSARLTVIR